MNMRYNQSLKFCRTKQKRRQKLVEPISKQVLITRKYLTLVENVTITNELFLGTLDLNPCLNVHCPRFGVCRTYSAHDARCECDDQCPSYQDPVCTANGTTYDNQCWHKLSYCRGLENNLVYHPGSCEGNDMPCRGGGIKSSYFLSFSLAPDVVLVFAS